MPRHSLTATRPTTPDLDAVVVGDTAAPGRHTVGAPAETATAEDAAAEDPTAEIATAGSVDTLSTAVPAPRHPVDVRPHTGRHGRREPDRLALVQPRPSAPRHAVTPPGVSPTMPGWRRPRRGRRRRTALVLVTVAAGLLALPTVSSASVDQCRWQRAAHALLVALHDNHDSRSQQLRDALAQAGVGPRLPAECVLHTRPGSTDPRPTTHPSPPSSPVTTEPATDDPTATPAPTSPPTSPSTSAPTTTKPSKTPSHSSGTGTPSTSAQSTTAPSTTAPSTGTGSGSTAAAAFGWGTPEKSDDFTGGLSGWGLYDGPGHDGNGRRTPSAAKVANGVLTITGDSDGNSEGMAWGDGQKYGRWEARVRSTPGDENYHPVMLLWPDAENWPVGGEIDWMEISDPSRQNADTFLHYGRDNDQVSGSVDADATQWHNWAVEWSPHGVTTYLDGKPWWSTKDSSILPPGPMHMTIQLDFFGGSHPKTSQMQVDWVKQYGM